MSSRFDAPSGWRCPFARVLELALALASTACMTPAALAAEGAAAEADTIPEVVVTATRREEKLKDVPVSASVLSGDALQVLGDTGDDIKQLAFKVPSLNIESSNGRAFPRFYIRGYGNTDFTDFASQPVSLLYDDIIQENPALKGFPILDQGDVEVLRGPQGTLFGRNSPAGVVKLESAKPQLGETTGDFSLSDGTYNSAVFQGIINLPVSDQMAFRASVQGQHRDNWVNDPINLTTLGGYDDWAARLQLLFQPSDGFTALFNVHGRSLTGSSTLFRANIISRGSNDLIPGFDPATMYADGPNSSNLSTIGTNVHLTWSLPGMTLQSITGYESVQRYLAEGDIDGGYGPGAAYNCPPQCSPQQRASYIEFPVQTSAGLNSHEQLTQEFRVVSKNDGPLQGQAGVFLFYESVTAADDDYCAPGDGAFVPVCAASNLWSLLDTEVSRQKNDAEAIFGSLEYTVTSDFKARAGVRFTEDHKEFAVLYNTSFPPPSPPLSESSSASNVSWDVSATYTLNSDVNLYARIATGFRAPEYDAPGTATGEPIQFAKSETNISYETGVKADLFERRARVAFDVYYYDVSHQQLTAVGGNENTTQLLNAQSTIGKGAELDFDAQLAPNLFLSLNGSYNYTRIDDPSLTVGVCAICTVTNPIVPVGGVPALGIAAGAAGNAEINGNPLPPAAKWVGNAALRYDVPLGAGRKLYGYADLSYRSEVNFFLYESKEFTGAPLFQAGLRLGYAWGNGKYDAAIFCRNCTNEIRAIGGIDFDDNLGYINDPRIVGAQLRVKF